jgi:outer membrane receptor protein involved in Fe transport
MPFQSDSNWSLSGLFENDLMSARVVYTYRDDFILFGIDAQPSFGRYVKGYGILDASVNFNLPHDLTLSFNASNLTDQGPDRYVGQPGGYESPFELQHFVNGRVYGIGIRHNFGR